MSIEILDVWVKGRKVGELIQEDYEYTFQYQDIASLDPDRDLVSLTMPVRAKRYDTQFLMPPFQMPLPEGALLENLRTRFGKIMDISNDIVLLKLVGNNTIGRVRFTAKNEALKVQNQSVYSLKELLSYPETEDLFKDLLDQLAPHSGVSGVQPKVLWTEHGKKVALVSDQYILKSAGRDYPGLAVNEFFCLEAAKACGLTTPDFYLTENNEMLVIKRFDGDENRQLAFEEVCALLNRPNHGKYTGSYEEVADLIQKVPCEPVGDANRDFFKSVVLSMMLRNGDAHLKNFGILYDDVKRKWLAPTYDLVTTTVYVPKDVPALTIAGAKQWPDISTLKSFGLHACGLRKKELNVCMDEVKAGIEAIKPKMRYFSGKHKSMRELCDRMLDAMKLSEES
jgi:serine/threonine-protein kinase HipA